MKKINVFLMCICSLFFFTGCNTNEFEENGENGESNVSKDGAIETLKEVANFIDEQTDLEINVFQINLLTWLKGNENVKEVIIGENKDFITVKLKNGSDFYINFQDMAIFDDVDDTESTSSRSSDVKETEKTFWDVSFEKDEKIIEKNKILYIQGIDMFLSYADDEKKEFIDLISKSPVVNELVTVSKSLLFLDENFSDYGIIIVAQTHGSNGFINGNKVTGAFDVEDRNIDFSNNKLKDVLNNRAIIVYTENKEDKYIEVKDYKESIFIITPKLISKRMADNNETIFYGSYCWSYGMANSLKNTVYGYETKMPYRSGREYFRLFLTKILNGLTYEKTYTYISESYWDYSKIWGKEIKPNTNNQSSKLRYFSISTDEITSTNANGQPIITGKINGYKNLKKDELTYLIYFHEGDKDFSPDLAKCIILKTSDTFNINEDGSFKFDFPDSLKTNSKYRMAFAFKYKDTIYYGERKEVTMKEEEKMESDDIKAYLKKLYEDTDGDNWKNKKNWLSDRPVEEWFGILKDKNSGLYEINLSCNNLNGFIDLSGCKTIYEFRCESNTMISNYENNLTSISLQGCTALKIVDCSSLNLTSLDISGCTALEYLWCQNNKLKKLDVSKCTALERLYCQGNNLTSLDVSKCSVLSDLMCDYNHIVQEITPYFRNLDVFSHDQLYEYYIDFLNYPHTLKYRKNEYGWYYPGEPESMEHDWSSSDAPHRQINKK